MWRCDLRSRYNNNDMQVASHRSIFYTFTYTHREREAENETIPMPWGMNRPEVDSMKLKIRLSDQYKCDKYEKWSKSLRYRYHKIENIEN